MQYSVLHGEYARRIVKTTKKNMNKSIYSFPSSAPPPQFYGKDRFIRPSTVDSRQRRLLRRQVSPSEAPYESVLHSQLFPSPNTTSLRKDGGPFYLGSPVTPASVEAIPNIAKLVANASPTSASSIDLNSAMHAPGLVEDFYTSVVSWSSTNKVAIGLGMDLYVLDSARQRTVTSSIGYEEEEQTVPLSITSVAWTACGRKVLVGTSSGSVYLVNPETNDVTLLAPPPSASITCIASSSSSPFAYATGGGPRGAVVFGDLRQPSRLYHTAQARQGSDNVKVCGLAWAPLDTLQLASGSNDDVVRIWDCRNLSNFYATTTAAEEGAETEVGRQLNGHTAAVKALAWSPHRRHVLASGGGSKDETIRIWHFGSSTNTSSSFPTGSQVCNLAWTHADTIISSHGFKSNALYAWKVGLEGLGSMATANSATGATLSKVVSVKNAHARRVIGMAVSHDGSQIATAASDECLKMWSLSADMCFHRPKRSRRWQGATLEDRCYGIR